MKKLAALFIIIPLLGYMGFVFITPGGGILPGIIRQFVPLCGIILAVKFLWFASDKEEKDKP